MTSTSLVANSSDLGIYCAGKRGPALKAFVAAFCVSILSTGASAADNPPLRLCADPDNIPFSSDRSDNPGIYREIGAAIAQELGRPLTEVWYRTNFGKRALRVTLLAKQCDLAIGLPGESDFMGPALIFSKPFMQAGYALVFKKPGTASSLSDIIGKAVAVQFNSTPQLFLATNEKVRMVTQMSPEDGVKALSSGEADAAFVWGPTAGYLNKTVYSGDLTIIPVNGPGMQWPVAIAFAKRNVELRDAVNGALERIGGKIADLKEKYGFPTAEPITLAEGPGVTDGAKAEEQAAMATPSSAKADTPTAAAAEAMQPAAPAEESKPAAEPVALTPPPAVGVGDDDKVREGKEVFNGTCAHCHGPNAEQAERKIDLRLLHHRYKDAMEEMFFKTVLNGRPSKGMPAWKDVFTQEQFVSIFAFLKTVQAD